MKEKYAEELYQALKNLLEAIPIIAGDNRHDKLTLRIYEADKLIRDIKKDEYEERLKPCPFCGGKAVLLDAFHGSSKVWHVVCSACMASSLYNELEVTVIDYWNKRAETSYSDGRSGND